MMSELTDKLRSYNQSSGYSRWMREAAARIDDLEHSWISVEDRLPEYSCACLGSFDTGGRWVVHYSKGKFEDYDDEPITVTHWMHFPDNSHILDELPRTAQLYRTKYPHPYKDEPTEKESDESALGRAIRNYWKGV